MDIEKTATGIPGLDDILMGGLARRNSYLLVGAPGTGKTIFSLQWLVHGRANGERCLYITLAEPARKVRQNASSLGWDLGDIAVVDFSATDVSAEPARDEYHIFPPSEVENVPVWQGLYEAIEKYKPTRVTIDSLTQLRYLSTDEYQFRKQVLALVSFLDSANCTTLLIYEPGEFDREASVALAVDGIIRLRMQVSPNRLIGLRSICVEKYRGSDFIAGYHGMRITQRGIETYPHIVETLVDDASERELLSSGNDTLDQLLGGGLESRTTTLFTGPAGVGKSTIVAHFVARAAQTGTCSVIYAFEESAESIAHRCRGIGLDIAPLVERGDLKIIYVNPMQLYPDEFLGMIRREVECGCRVMAIDSLRGYSLAMEEFGNPIAHLQNMATYLYSHGVTTMLVNELEFITGDLRATELGISHIADNIVLLRYAEYEGRVMRIVGCLKKRLGGFEPELRPVTIGSEGLHIGEKLHGLHGILTGLPVPVRSNAP